MIRGVATTYLLHHQSSEAVAHEDDGSGLLLLCLPEAAKPHQQTPSRSRQVANGAAEDGRRIVAKRPHPSHDVGFGEDAGQPVPQPDGAVIARPRVPPVATEAVNRYDACNWSVTRPTTALTGLTRHGGRSATVAGPAQLPETRIAQSSRLPEGLRATCPDLDLRLATGEECEPFLDQTSSR